MTLEPLTITSNASDASIHQLHGHRDGLTYTIPLVAEVPAWLIDYPKVNGIPTQEVTITRTFGGPNKGTTVILKVGALPPVPADLAAAVEHFAPKTVKIGKLDMSTPLVGEDPDPLLASFSDKVLNAADISNPSTRLTGSNVTIQIFKGEALQDDLALIKDFVITFADSVMIEFTAHLDSGAYIDLINTVSSGAEYRMAVSLLAPSGARTVLLERLTFKVIKISAADGKALVEARFTVLANSFKIVR